MKKMLLSMFLIISILCQAQILKKANTISIARSGTQMECFNQVNTLLLEAGYGILNTDKELGIISTTEKSFKNGSIKLNFLIKDHKILLRGDFKDNLSLTLGGVTSGPSWNVIQNIGQKNSITQNAWNEMNKVAEAIPGEKEYLIK
jgi:hypothetical protein